MATVYKMANESWLSQNISKGLHGVHAVMADITPQLAHELLSRNPDNRPCNSRRVEVYADDIRSGRWAANGESIVVSRDGLLNDGQHRCHAVIAANQSIPSIIVFGVDRKTRTTTNQGKAKGAGDYAGMQGVANANNIAAMARMAIAYFDGVGIQSTTRISHARILEYIEEHAAKLCESFRYAANHSKRLSGITSPSMVAFCHYICSPISQSMADEYYHQIGTGEGLRSGDPALTVRDRLRTLGNARAQQVEAILHGWNAYRRGRRLSFIKISGKLPEIG